MLLGILQTAVFSDKTESIRRAARGVRALAHAGAEFVILPEMWNCPYAAKNFPLYAEPRGGETFAALSDMARSSHIWLIGGSIPERDGAAVYNTSFVFSPDGVCVATHRKMHLFDIDVHGGQRFYESETLSAGNTVTTFDTPWGLFGLCICYDLRFPELCRLMALRGAVCVFVPAAFNMTTGPAHWDTLFRQRAVDNQLFTVGAAPARDTGAPYISYAHSLAVSPWGDVLFRAGTRPQRALVELDLTRIDAVRDQLPLLHHRRTDVYAVVEKN